jgi:hypothetical protein
MGRGRPRPHHDAWEAYVRMERTQLAQRDAGQLRRAIGRHLRGESREMLERMASEDERRARAGLVELREGERSWHKHIDDLTRDDRQARLEAEWARVAWLRGRVESERVVAAWRERGWDKPRVYRPERSEPLIRRASLTSL